MKIKLLLTIFLFFLVSCDSEEAKEETRAFTVTAITPEVRDLSEQIYFIGTLRAKEEVKVYSRVEGKIYDKLIRKGDEVEKDETLFTIDRDAVGYRFEKAKVEAPITGKVSLVYVDVGDRITPQEPVALLQNDLTVKAEIGVGAKDYPRIAENQRAYLRVPSYRQDDFEGVVSEVSPFFDSATHTALVEIEVDNKHGRLKPGMFCEIRIEVDRKEQALTVLFDAVLRDDEGEYVYILEDGRAEKRHIRTGLKDGTHLEVVSGIEKDEKIAYRGKEFLEDNAIVKAVME